MSPQFLPNINVWVPLRDYHGKTERGAWDYSKKVFRERHGPLALKVVLWEDILNSDWGGVTGKYIFKDVIRPNPFGLGTAIGRY